MTEIERSRLVTWQDPFIGSEAAKTMSGLEYLQAMLRGEIPRPPISNTLDFTLETVSEGHATFVVTPQEFHYNPIGVVHGGLAATLLDSAMGCAVQSTLQNGVGYTTLELHINLVRAITKDTGQLRTVAEVIHSGRSIATAQGRIIDSTGKIYAHGTTTCMIFRSV